MTEVCIIMRNYNKTWDDFLHKFVSYKPRMCIDNYNENSEPALVDVIYADSEECAREGFKNSSTCANFPEVIAWDKAIRYYIQNSDAEYIWFIEDDVFFMNEEVLKKIDEKYKTEDLLSAFHDINTTGDLYQNRWNHWINVEGKIGLPWAHSMICACRVSRRLLMEVGEYIKTHGTMFFVEAILNTLVLQKGMSIANPEELVNIHWLTEWDRDNIDSSKLYHPFKKIEDHIYMRERYNI